MMERIGADDNIKLVVFKMDFFGTGFNKMKIHFPLKKKRTLPLIFEAMKYFFKQKYDWLACKKLIFEGASYP